MMKVFFLIIVKAKFSWNCKITHKNLWHQNFLKKQLVYYYWIEYYPKSHISLLFLLIGKGKEDRPPMVSMMDEMQKTLARRRAKVERVEDVSRFLSSLLDNVPISLVGCVIQKRNLTIKSKLWVYLFQKYDKVCSHSLYLGSINILFLMNAFEICILILLV